MTGQHRKGQLRGLPLPMTAPQAFTTWWAQQDSPITQQPEITRHAFMAGIDWATTGAVPCPRCTVKPLVITLGMLEGIQVRCQSCGTRWALDDGQLARDVQKGGR